MSRSRVAKKLVRVSAWTIDCAYEMSEGRGWTTKDRRVRLWNRMTAPLGTRLLTTALWLDKETAVTQMIEEGWWG